MEVVPEDEELNTKALFSKSRMRQPSKNSNLFTLNISQAPSLRCLKSPVKSCGNCESCRLGVKLNHTKEWFPRCGEPAKRRFVLGLVRRFDSQDLLEYVTSLLQTFQYKDFTYTRSRGKPSLTVDTASPPTNHALDETQLDDTIESYWVWFSESAYWTKSSYMLGLMQLCDSHLLYIVSVKTRTLCERERRRQRAIDKGVIDRDEDEYMSLCSYVSTNSELQADTSTPSTSGTSGVHDIQMAETCSLSSDDKVTSRDFKLSDETTSKSPTPKCRDSAGILSAKSQCSTGYGGSPMFSHSCRRSIPPSRQSSTKSLLHMTDFERNFFSEDYISGEDSEEEDDYASIDPSVIVVASPSVSYLGVSKYKDFIRCLPVHLSKYIFSLLDKNSLTNCLCISKHWRLLAEEVQKDFLVHQLMTEEVMLMQGASAKGMNPRYAKYVPVFVPRDDTKDPVDPEQEPAKDKANEELSLTKKTKDRDNIFADRDMKECYEGIPTLVIVLEERNVYCGAYNLLVLQDGDDPHRCANFSGGRLVVSGSYDRRLRLIDASSGKVERTIQGHAGSIRCVLVSEERGTVLSGGYDTSIRSWDINRGNCKCIFRGHRSTVLCIALHGNHLASGSRDKSVKVWNFSTGKCRRTFRHRHIVLAVDVSDTVVVSGCEGGKVKVWDIESATLIKTLDGHHGAITCLKFNEQHIVTGSMDCYAMAWSAVGKHKKCLQAFRHPKDVLCLEFLYRRVMTGSADGKLRIWNMLNGDCLRIIRGNSKNDPITTIRCSGDRMIVNTLSNLLIFNFEAITWDYTLPPERPEGLGSVSTFAKAPPRKYSRAYVRAQKLMRADTKDSLPSRPPSRAALQSSENLNNVSVGEDFSKRIVSAPPRMRHQASTVSSIEEHIQRIFSARHCRLNRPQSSPAKTSLRNCSARLDVAPTEADSDLKGSMLITQVRQTYPRPPPLPDNRRPHVITRGRSAPAYRTQTLPADRRGWTTSAAEQLRYPENKIMVSAAQAREKVARQRPHSAQVQSSKEAICLNPVKSLSCLNLRTFSNQLQYEEKLKESGQGNKQQRKRHQRSASSKKLHRSVSCVPCVR